MIDIQWDQKFSIGHERIDNEHRVFLDLIRNASLAAEENASEERVQRLLTEVRKYAEFHFCSEENLMLDTAYPGYEEHKAQHERLLLQLEDCLHDYRNEKLNLNEIVDFMFNWFALHTTGSDKKLVSHIHND